jgi:hypothetical protein
VGEAVLVVVRPVELDRNAEVSQPHIDILSRNNRIELSLSEDRFNFGKDAQLNAGRRRPAMRAPVAAVCAFVR